MFTYLSAPYFDAYIEGKVATSTPSQPLALDFTTEFAVIRSALLADVKRVRCLNTNAQAMDVIAQDPAAIGRSHPPSWINEQPFARVGTFNSKCVRVRVSRLVIRPNGTNVKEDGPRIALPDGHATVGEIPAATRQRCIDFQAKPIPHPQHLIGLTCPIEG